MDVQSDNILKEIKTFLKPRYFTATPVYLEFAPTYKWCHVHKFCTYCRLSGHLVPTCLLYNIFMTKDIHNISLTDPNPDVLCKDEIFNGEIRIPKTPPSFMDFFLVMFFFDVWVFS
eukprot:TRINITY_DN6663_c0_g2_i1.p1 TRINITY_DN6663_c0_g2~~TRINITY_DN6663_c0_g2_i1.p1  ORF type:complete len:116 (-),score=17.25 TRINITY_DN6663_c0_g2_i1:163-510(-)